MSIWQPFVTEWVSMLLRWLHVTAAIAWVGASFFFMHLDASLKRRAGQSELMIGSSWQVHGGGFYEMGKYALAPEHLPDDLIWHKWQAYWTWISGFALLCWVYYGQSSFFLIDPAVRPLTPWQAAGVGIGSLALGWIVYDLLCRSPVGKHEGLLALVGFGYIVLTSLVYAHVFSGRGALLHAGALMATLMAGNVFLIISPNQRRTVKALLAGQAPDPKWGKQAKQRSTHNNYITLPALFMMLSNHYPMTYANASFIPLITACVILAGALVRYFYNAWHADEHRAPWWAWGVAAAAMIVVLGLGMVAASLPKALPTVGLAAPAEVADIVQSRCAMCHAGEPVWEGVGEAPKGVLLDTPENIARFAGAVRMQAVLTRTMPPNNLTEMTEAERAKLAAWLQ